MRNYCEQLYEQMHLELEVISDGDGTLLEKATQSFFAVESAMEKLRQFIYDHTFVDNQEEIDFFKIEKPRFHHELIYWAEVIRLETDRPKGTRKAQIAFYERDEFAIKEQLSRNKILLIYYRMNQQYYDHVLFLRNAEMVALRPEVQIDLDKRFTTFSGSQLAQIQAWERTLKYIAECIAKLKSRSFYIPDSAQSIPKLRWTSSKADLIECFYALHTLGAFNNGKTSIKHVFQWAEAHLDIKVTHYYNYMMKMRIRKKERAPFLKKAISELYFRMDQSDEFPRFM
jgi:hypothetical protein